MSLKPNSNKSLSNVLDESFSVFSRFFHCVKIGEIQSFDKQNQTVSVKILYKGINDYNLQERELVDFPVLEQVPVVVLGGGGTYISYPIKKGDDCVLLFNDYELDGWWSSGEARPSEFPRRHDLSDAIAIVGLNSLVSLIKDYSDFLKIHYSDSSNITVGNTIEITNQTINLNGNSNVSGNETVSGTVTGEVHSTHGASGSFSNAAGQTLTIVDGVITSIS